MLHTRHTVEAGHAAAERGGNNLKGSKDVRTEFGSSQGQNMALTGLFIPSSLDTAEFFCAQSPGLARPFWELNPITVDMSLKWRVGSLAPAVGHT